MIGDAIAVIGLVVSVLLLYVLLKGWNKSDQQGRIPGIILMGIAFILSIIHLKGSIYAAQNATSNESSFAGFIILCFAVFFVMVMFVNNNNNKALREQETVETKKIGALDYVYGCVISGINLPVDTKCRLLIFNEHLLIESEQNSFKININQIKGAFVNTEKEIIEKEKSVIGRAVVGGVTLGPIGAIIGGISGVGTKSENIHHLLLIITYINSSNEPSALVFKQYTMKNLDRLNAFASAVNNLIPKEIKKQIVEL